MDIIYSFLFQVLRLLKEQEEVSPSTKVIGVSMHSQPAYAKKMLQIERKVYVTKNSSKEENDKGDH